MHSRNKHIEIKHHFLREHITNGTCDIKFKASNNQAEYEALIAGMLLAKEMGARSLLVKSDS